MSDPIEGSSGGRQGADEGATLISRLWEFRWFVAVTLILTGALTWAYPERWLLFVLGAAVVVLSGIWPSTSVTRRLAPARKHERRNAGPSADLRQLTEALDFPAYILDTRFRLVHANAAGVDAFGSARLNDDITLKFRAPELSEFAKNAIRSGERDKMEYHQPVPQETWYKVDIAPIPDRPDERRKTGQAPEFYLFTFRDVSASRQIDRMRADFIANASHELRTPLTSLRGYVETMQTKPHDMKSARELFLPIMLEQAERMSRLIDDLLSLSKLEVQTHLRHREPVELVEIVSHVSDALSQLAIEAGVKIELELPEQALVPGKRDELIQVVENLFENACKYGDEGKRVIAGVKESTADPNQYEVYVQDFGPGIPAEHLSRLTERFYRVDVATSRAKQGTGLGLAIVKHVLLRHNSRLQVTSKLGEGSRFFFRISKYADTPPAPRVSLKKAAQENLENTGADSTAANG